MKVFMEPLNVREVAKQSVPLVVLAVLSASCGGGGLGITVTDPTKLLLTVPRTSIEWTVERQLVAITPVIAKGGAGTYSFSAIGLPAGLTVDNGTGAITGTPTRVLPRSTVTVYVADQFKTDQTKPKNDSAKFSLKINEKPAANLDLTQSDRQITQNSPLSGYSPITGAGGTGQLRYTINPSLPAGLVFNNATAGISGNPTSTLPLTNFAVTVTDSAGATGAAQFALKVNPELLLTLSTTSIAATPGVPIVPVIPTATGGTAPITYAVNGIPASIGLTADALGRISGVPNGAVAPATITVEATDGAGARKSVQLLLSVSNVLSAASAVPTKACTQLVACSYRPVIGGGGTGALSYSVSPLLVSGLGFNAATGEITGAPTTASQAAAYIVKVRDTNGGEVTANFSLSISMPVIATGVALTKVCTQGGPCNVVPIAGSGGTAPLTYTTTPALPNGLVLNASGGQVTGSATTSLTATTFTVSVTDVNGSNANKPFVLAVNPSLTTTLGASTYACTKGMICAFTPVVSTGGTAPVMYELTSGALAAGLALNPGTGTISGTATETTSASLFRVTAIDAAGATSSKDFSFAVNGPPSANVIVAAVASTANVALPAGLRPVTGSGGTGALMYAIAPALPNGLQLNAATGALTGTPLVASGTKTYRITVSDQAGGSAFNDFILTVNATPLLVGTNVQCVLVITCTVSPISLTGGTAPFVFTIAPALPTGLTLNRLTGVISGNVAGTFPPTTYSVTLVDAVGASAAGTFVLTSTAGFTTALVIPEVSCGASSGCSSPSPFAPVTATNGVLPIVFSISPTLPPGFLFDATMGKISNPTVSAGFAPMAYTITATDGVGQMSSHVFTLSMLQATRSSSAQTCTFQVFCSFNLYTPVGGKAPLSWVITGLSPGLSANSSTGFISGTPTQTVDPYYPDVVIMDALGSRYSSFFTLRVLYSPVVAVQSIASVACGEDNGCTTAVPFTPVKKSGGGPGTMYTISPTLPAGLTSNPLTGEISGTPTAGIIPTTYSVLVTDFSTSSTATFVLSVLRSTVAVAAKTCSVGVLCEFKPLTVIGGMPALTYSLSGVVPNGMTFSTTLGMLSGSPTSTLAARTFTITVSDGATPARVSSKTFTLTVN